MTAPLQPLTDEQLDEYAALITTRKAHDPDRLYDDWSMDETLISDDRWHRAEIEKLQNAYFVDQTIAPNEELRPTISRLVERALGAAAETAKLRQLLKSAADRLERCAIATGNDADIAAIAVQEYRAALALKDR